MIKKTVLGWLLPLSFVLAACPFESSVPLAPGPSEPVDTSLFGYWYGIIKDGSDVFGIEALEISGHSDSVYSITRYGKGVKDNIITPDTSYYTGFTTYIDGNPYMNVEGSITISIPQRKKDPVVRKEKIYYLALMNRRHDTLTVKTITDGFSPTRRPVRTPQDLSQLVSETLGQKLNIYDEMYTLSYRKIAKPKQIYPNR